jgi:hypothetical protein
MMDYLDFGPSDSDSEDDDESLMNPGAAIDR